MFRSIANFVLKALNLGTTSIYYNDPTTADLYGNTVIPELCQPCPAFTVVGWTGKPGGQPGSPQFQAAQVYTTMVTALNFIQKVSGQPILKNWAATHNLVAIPRAGQQLNAYYDRTSLRFFYYMDQPRNNIVYGCESVDVVAHELGHAVLDALRPDFWSTTSLEIFALHEAFGDIVAMLTVLQFDQVVQKVLQETGGDLRKSNVATRIAEELGGAIYAVSGGRLGGNNYLRNAANELEYVEPESLPTHPSGEGLAKEPHNFSRVFTGAWYECVVEIFQRELSKMEPAAALRHAATMMALRLFHGVMAAPSTPRFFESLSRSMLAMDRAWGSPYSDLMSKVFIKRKILKPFAFGLTNLNQELKLMDTIKLDPGTEGNRLRLSMAGPVEEASEIVVDLPKFGIAGDFSGEQTVDTAKECLRFIKSQNLIGSEYECKMFAVVDGKLQRNFICNAFRRE